MAVPARPKIYHIAPVDRLQSIIADDCLWCDAEISRRKLSGTTIGMSRIKQRRLTKLTLTSHPGLHVGDCVPFYFCPRSVMLYVIAQANHPELTYRGGQGPIVHMEADLYTSVAWAQQNKRRWAFTLSNAGSTYFEDRNDLEQLAEINWEAVQTHDWRDESTKESKQAEFLMEFAFPWHLIERIGVYSQSIYQKVMDILPAKGQQPRVEIRPEWYY
ncbi:MAG: DUF4433 domain-containing protein [Anaerolineae bacterium]|jgi:hypothetical protein|nr:DUF4433 domain-containing protein [Anaerolineae bacterium]